MVGDRSLFATSQLNFDPLTRQGVFLSDAKYESLLALVNRFHKDLDTLSLRLNRLLSNLELRGIKSDSLG